MSINFTRLPGYDINGNPRYVCHYVHLLTEQEKGDPKLSFIAYDLAITRAHKIGGKRYRAKWYGGGIVFQSYNIRELERDIEELVKKESGA